MIKNSTIIHLRFPFSVFLLPIYLFALSQSPHIDPENSILAFVILHLLVYPASNGFNSYFDRDKGSIGGIKSPPKVTRELYWVSLAMDIAALLLSIMVSATFFIGILIYGAASKAYSHPSIRLKKYAVAGWLTIGVFQGFLIYIICFMGINNLSVYDAFKTGWAPGLLATALLLGSYPMTQIYQHDEDSQRGDFTLSYKLGILGTFHFTATFFFFATLGFFFYFLGENPWEAIGFLVFLLPTIIYFGLWYKRVRNDLASADYESTMNLNLISSIGLSLFFLTATFLI